MGQVVLSVRRIRLEQAILNLLQGTNLFPDSTCANYGIISLNWYF